jgi:hypothetical protein
MSDAAKISRRRENRRGREFPDVSKFHGADRRAASKARRYRKRRKTGHRIWKLELDTVATEELLSGLGYLPEGFTKKEADEALAKFVTMLATVTGDDMRFEFALRETIALFESAGDQMP